MINSESKLKHLDYIDKLPQSFRNDYISLLDEHHSEKLYDQYTVTIFHDAIIQRLIEKCKEECQKICIEKNPIEWLTYKKILSKDQFVIFFYDDLHEVTRNSVLGLLNSLDEQGDFSEYNETYNKLMMIHGIKVKHLAKKYSSYFIKYHKILSDDNFYQLFCNLNQKILDLCEELLSCYNPDSPSDRIFIYIDRKEWLNSCYCNSKNHNK